MLTLRIRAQLRWRYAQDTIYWFDLKLAQDQGFVFWQAASKAIILYDSMRADRLVKAVKRSDTDDEMEVLFQKVAPQPRHVTRVVLKPNRPPSEHHSR